MATHALPAAPERLIAETGAPAFGLYQGSVRDARFGGLRPAPGLMESWLSEKRWQYVLVVTPEVMLTLAIVDAGYLGGGFCVLFDRQSRRLLVDSNPVVPPLFARVGDAPADGLSAALNGPLAQARIERSGGRVLVEAEWEHAHVALSLDAGRAPPPFTAIAGVGVEQRFDFTQKLALVPADGEIRAGNVQFEVRDQLAALDYTHGMLARETTWRWAFGMQEGLAFNLSEGFLQGEGENVAWLDGAPRPLGVVSIQPGEEGGEWRLRGENVDLSFTSHATRTQRIDLKLIRSNILQPFGTFSGTILGREVRAVPGVAEDHAALW